MAGGAIFRHLRETRIEFPAAGIAMRAVCPEIRRPGTSMQTVGIGFPTAEDRVPSDLHRVSEGGDFGTEGPY